jgi:hypothetical protein
MFVNGKTFVEVLSSVILETSEEKTRQYLPVDVSPFWGFTTYI